MSFQPSATKITHVMMSVAIVMPEIGLEDDPISPVMRDDTVAKKKPNTMMRTDARMLPCVGSPGITIRKIGEDERAAEDDGHRDVALGAQRPPPAAAPNPLRPSRADEMIVGSVRPSVMRPAASTAPAPM